MKCIKEDLIQKYMDGETTDRELTVIRKHISHCERCTEKIEAKERFSRQLKEAIRAIDVKKTDIPVLTLPDQIKDRRTSTFRIALYVLSAACILLFALVFTLRQEQEPEEEIIFLYNPGWEYDANATLSEQEMIMGIIDAEGNMNEYFEE